MLVNGKYSIALIEIVLTGEQGLEMITTEQRLENAIKHQPDRYLVFRNYGKLFEVHDKDTGRLWLKIRYKERDIWAWID